MIEFVVYVYVVGSVLLGFFEFDVFCLFFSVEDGVGMLFGECFECGVFDFGVVFVGDLVVGFGGVSCEEFDFCFGVDVDGFGYGFVFCVEWFREFIFFYLMSF